MTLPAPTYDLVLLLDTQAEESTRAKILADARASIQARGEIVRDDDWGERPLSYPIAHRKSAEYHLIQFHVSDKDLLSGLDRTLRITDGVMRFRLIKLRPGTPDPPDMRSSSAPPRRADGEAPAAPPQGEGETAAAVPAAEAPAAAPAEAPAPAAPAAEAAPGAPAAPAETPPPAAPAEQAPAGDEQPAAEAPPAEAASPEAPVPEAPVPEAEPGEGADTGAAPADDAS